MSTAATASRDEDVRYNLRLPRSVYDKLGQTAQEQGLTRLELLKKFVKLGFLVTEASQNEGFYVKRDGELEKIYIL